MTYEDIIRRIADNLGLSPTNGIFRAVARRDIYDVLQLIVRKSEFPRKLYEVTIANAESSSEPPIPFEEADMPSDFYLPIEVMFFASNGNRFGEIELTRETYEKWIPDVAVTTDSFNELVTGASPQELIWTQENFDYDGYIGYVFTATHPRKILWKPPVNGTLRIYYTNDLTQFTAEQYGNTPGIHKVFQELVVDSVTVKQLTRKYRTIKGDQVALEALRSELSEYKTKVRDGSADFIGYSQKDAETDRVEGFNFLNDPSMLI